METPTPAPVRRPSLRPRWVLAGVTAAAVVAVAVAAGWGDQAPRTTPHIAASASATASGTGQPAGPSGDVYGPNASLKCVEEYTDKNLAKRAFAFDGAVTAIGKPDRDGLYVPVTFQVAHWYRGGSGAAVVVEMLVPDRETTVESTPFRVGSRLLVSGQARFSGDPTKDPVAWACGFTRWYAESDAAVWQRAFA